MEFKFNCEDALGCNSQGYAILEGSYENNIRECYKLHITGILDCIGEESSKQQGLNVVKTSFYKFFHSQDRMFIKAEKNVIIGYLRVGKRRIFIRDEQNNYFQEDPITVIDFYIVKNYERQGFGKVSFNY